MEQKYMNIFFTTVQSTVIAINQVYLQGWKT